MKKLAENKWMPIVSSALITVIGVLTFVFTLVNIGIVDQVISYSLAAALFIIGLVYILVSLIGQTVEFFSGSLILGCLSIALGIVLCIVPNIMGAILTYFAGALLLSLGLFAIIKAVLFIVYRQKVSWIILYIVAALVCIAGGVLVFCFTGEAKVVIYCIVGAAVAVIGILGLILSIKSAKKKE